MSNPFDMGGMGGLGALLGGFQQRVEDAKRQAAETEVEGAAGGDLVKVRMTCDFEVTGVTIAPAAMADREMLEDLLRAAMGEATRKARDEMARGLQALAGGLPIPPGLLGF
jgi:DNA-binding YbaB/EbfC family protein